MDSKTLREIADKALRESGKISDQVLNNSLRATQAQVAVLAQVLADLIDEYEHQHRP